jgi:hypothetical protein
VVVVDAIGAPELCRATRPRAVGQANASLRVLYGDCRSEDAIGVVAKLEVGTRLETTEGTASEATIDVASGAEDGEADTDITENEGMGRLTTAWIVAFGKSLADAETAGDAER